MDQASFKTQADCLASVLIIFKYVHFIHPKLQSSYMNSVIRSLLNLLVN